jgi:hypothetical protein
MSLASGPNPPMSYNDKLALERYLYEKMKRETIEKYGPERARATDEGLRGRAGLQAEVIWAQSNGMQLGGPGKQVASHKNGKWTQEELHEQTPSSTPAPSIPPQTLDKTAPSSQPGLWQSLVNKGIAQGEAAVQSVKQGVKNVKDGVVAATNRVVTAFDNSIVEGVKEVNKIVKALEGKPEEKKGSRKTPSILKYPLDIGTTQMPHVMQFKIFWRFEKKELKDAKVESDKVTGLLNNLGSLAAAGQFTTAVIGAVKTMRGDKSQGISELVATNKDSKPIDMSMAVNVALTVAQLKAMAEGTPAASQDSVTSAESEGVNFDVQERQLVSNRVSSNLEKTNATEVGIKVGAVAAVTGAVTAAGLSRQSGKSWRESIVKGGLAGLGSGLAAGVAAGIGTALTKALQNSPKYDQMVSIYLPICNKIGNEDTFIYDDANTMVAQGMLDALNNTLDSIAQGAVAGGLKLADKVGQAGTVTALTGYVINPRIERIFKAKDYRTFQFTWEMYPRSPDESKMIKTIVDTFRYHANPAHDEEVVGQEASNASIILRAPAEFEVRFLSSHPNPKVKGWIDNPTIPQIARLACESISVDYTVNGVFSTFEDNSPTAISLTLSFKEIELTTREQVGKGF